MLEQVSNAAPEEQERGAKEVFFYVKSTNRQAREVVKAREMQKCVVSETRRHG